MPSDKERVAAYVDAETLQQFRVVAAMNGMSMSAYLTVLIKQAISQAQNPLKTSTHE